MKREGVSTLFIVVIYGLSIACSLYYFVCVFLKSFEMPNSTEICFMITLISILKSLMKCFEIFFESVRCEKVF